MGVWVAESGVQRGGPGCSCKSQGSSGGEWGLGPRAGRDHHERGQAFDPLLLLTQPRPLQASPCFGRSVPSRNQAGPQPWLAWEVTHSRDKCIRKQLGPSWPQTIEAVLLPGAPSPAPSHPTQTASITRTGTGQEAPVRSMIIEFKELIAASAGVV